MAYRRTPKVYTAFAAGGKPNVDQQELQFKYDKLAADTSATMAALRNRGGSRGGSSSGGDWTSYGESMGARFGGGGGAPEDLHLGEGELSDQDFKREQMRHDLAKIKAASTASQRERAIEIALLRQGEREKWAEARSDREDKQRHERGRFGTAKGNQKRLLDLETHKNKLLGDRELALNDARQRGANEMALNQIAANFDNRVHEIQLLQQKEIEVGQAGIYASEQAAIRKEDRDLTAGQKAAAAERRIKKLDADISKYGRKATKTVDGKEVSDEEYIAKRDKEEREKAAKIAERDNLKEFADRMNAQEGMRKMRRPKEGVLEWAAGGDEDLVSIFDQAREGGAAERSQEVGDDDEWNAEVVRRVAGLEAPLAALEGVDWKTDEGKQAILSAASRVGADMAEKIPKNSADRKMAVDTIMSSPVIAKLLSLVDVDDKPQALREIKDAIRSGGVSFKSDEARGRPERNPTTAEELQAPGFMENAAQFIGGPLNPWFWRKAAQGYGVLGQSADQTRTYK